MTGSPNDKVQRELIRIPRAFSRRVVDELATPIAPPDGWHPPAADRPVRTARLTDSAELIALKAEYQARFGKQLNADHASELFPEYAQSLTARALFGPRVRGAAAQVVDALFLDLLDNQPAQPLVVFTAGGNGAGKTSSLVPAAESEATIQFDSTFSLPSASMVNVQRAHTAGFSVLVVLIWRDPIDALVHGTLPRAMRIGRTVPLSSHIRTHLGAPRTVNDLMDRFSADEVTVAIFENTSAEGGPALILRDRAWLGTRPRVTETELFGELRDRLERERAARRINDAVYVGTLGRVPGES